MTNAAYWISRLNLAPHPEGGWFRQTYAATLTIPRNALPPQFTAARPASTAIYFLLDAQIFSAFHRLRSDELWHFYSGGPLIVYVIDSEGRLDEMLLGGDPDAGESFQGVVKAGCWLAARVKNPRSYALVGCTMAPGFDFADFELATRSDLAAQYPQHRALIESLTRA
ncbi:MAG TPA: cupin domain-containing protein [Candidatus Acidoferrales bacterium]|nr:cupin domain-containing protein [Candidatus Acidoferrales bacterium]